MVVVACLCHPQARPGLSLALLERRKLIRQLQELSWTALLAMSVQHPYHPPRNAATASDAEPGLGAAASRSVISLDDIIADIQQQEAAEASASSIEASSADNPGSSASFSSQAGFADPSLGEQQPQDDTAPTAHASFVGGANPGKANVGGTYPADPGVSREAQASTASAAVASVSEEAIPGTSAGQSREFQAASDTNDTLSDVTRTPIETTAEGFHVLSQTQSDGMAQPDSSAQSSAQSTLSRGSSLAYEDESSPVSSGAAAQHPAVDGSAPSSLADASQSRETQATTQTLGQTQASTESIPGTPAGQSRQFRADSGSPSNAEIFGSPTYNLHTNPVATAAGGIDNPGEAEDSSQSRESQAEPEASSTSTPSTTFENDLGQSADMSQSREAQAVTSVAASPATREAVFGTSAGQSRESQASSSATRRSQQKPFREPSPLPASFKLRPSSPAQSLNFPDISASEASGTLGTGRRTGSNDSVSNANTSRSSTSRSNPAKDFAASIGKSPGSSPYERRRSSRSTGPMGPGSGAGQYPAGMGFGSSSSSGSRRRDPDASPGAEEAQQPRVTSRRFGSNVWDPNQPDFVGFPDEDRVVRGGKPHPCSKCWCVACLLGGPAEWPKNHASWQDEHKESMNQCWVVLLSLACKLGVTGGGLLLPSSAQGSRRPHLQLFMDAHMPERQLRHEDYSTSGGVVLNILGGETVQSGKHLRVDCTLFKCFQECIAQIR